MIDPNSISRFPEPVWEEIKCEDCDDWDRCPCGCEWGWCDDKREFSREDDGCDIQVG